jgi:hypothetical protein
VQWRTGDQKELGFAIVKERGGERDRSRDGAVGWRIGVAEGGSRRWEGSLGRRQEGEGGDSGERGEVREKRISETRREVWERGRRERSGCGARRVWERSGCRPMQITILLSIVGCVTR